MSELLPSHDLDEDGEHDPDACYECLLGQEVRSSCRCGKCCALLIEATLEDAKREPRIAERGSPIHGIAGERDGYLLNDRANGYACTFLDRTTKLCTIYATRPLLCRLFDCDGEGREQLIELGILPERREA